MDRRRFTGLCASALASWPVAGLAAAGARASDDASGTGGVAVPGPRTRLLFEDGSPVRTGDGESREFPFYGYDYGFEPALDSYILPYSVADVEGAADGGQKDDAQTDDAQADDGQADDGQADDGQADGVRADGARADGVEGETLTLVTEPVKVATLGTPDPESDSIQASLDAEALFAFDSAELKLGAEQAITDLLVELEDAPDLARIEVVGHTDSVGPDAYNLELSRARAEAVAEFVRADFPDVEVTARGMGEREPQAPNDTPEGRQLNRRVDVTAFRG